MSASALCPACFSILQPDTAACILCGEPTQVDEGELAYHQQCAEDLLRHGQCDPDPHIDHMGYIGPSRDEHYHAAYRQPMSLTHCPVLAKGQTSSGAQS